MPGRMQTPTAALLWIIRIGDVVGLRQPLQTTCAARIKPASLQNRFHAKTHYDRALRAFCCNKNIVYQSFWTLTADPQILAAPAVTVTAEKYGRTPAQVFFRYLTQSGTACLTGTSSPEHMAQDLAIFDFCLTAREGEAIGAQLK